MRPQVDFVDHEEVGAGGAETSLAGDVIPAGDIQDEDPDVHQATTERHREVVTAAFDQQQVKRLAITTLRVVRQLLRGLQVDRDVVADGAVWAGPGLHRNDALGREHTPILEVIGVFGGEDVVGHHTQSRLIP